MKGTFPSEALLPWTCSRPEKVYTHSPTRALHTLQEQLCSEPLPQPLWQSALCWNKSSFFCHLVIATHTEQRTPAPGSETRSCHKHRHTFQGIACAVFISGLLSCSSVWNSREASKGEKHWISMATVLTFYLVMGFVYFFSTELFLES